LSEDILGLATKLMTSNYLRNILGLELMVANTGLINQRVSCKPKPHKLRDPVIIGLLEYTFISIPFPETIQIILNIAISM